MGRKQRVNFSLDPDVINLLEANEEYGERSSAVEEAIEEYYDE